MDKSKRQKGEIYLREWAQSFLKIEKLQVEINNINKKNSIFQDIYLDEKTDIENAYKEVLKEKKVQLKKVIKDYMLVDDIVNELEGYKKDIIYLRYIHKNSWQAIALKVHISLRQCFNIKNDVINKILDTMSEHNYDKT